MKPSYQIVDQNQTRQLARFFAENGQAILPMVELVEQSRMAVDDLLSVLGRATLEAILEISAANLAGPAHQGQGRNASLLRHGHQSATIPLSDRKVRVNKPRLRRREGGAGAEVSLPAYEAMQTDKRLSEHILSALMRGVSTRRYHEIVPDACEAAGIKKSSISRRFVAQSEKACQQFLERRFDDVRILAIYIDGLVFGEHHIVAAVGIDDAGCKHVLGVREGATENTATVTGLLEEMVAKGICADERRLFVIDGAKALRQAITLVYGSECPVQRCRVHKVRNICDHLPKDRRDDAKCALRAAFRMGYQEGRQRLLKLAQWYENEFPSAAASLREGLDELFTAERLGVPRSLSRCLVSTNLIESPNAGVRLRTDRVDRWKDGAMVLRWATTAFLEAESQFRRVAGYKDLWMLDAALNPQEEANAA